MPRKLDFYPQGHIKDGARIAQAREIATIEARDDLIDQLNLDGLSNRAIGKALQVSESLIRLRLREIVKRRILEQDPTTLSERLDLTTRRRLSLYALSVALANNTGAAPSARVLALQTANSILNDVDRLQGTVAPESLNSAVLAEVMDTVLGALQDADPAIQRRVLDALVQRAPANSQVGAFLTTAVPNAAASGRAGDVVDVVDVVDAEAAQDDAAVAAAADPVSGDASDAASDRDEGGPAIVSRGYYAVEREHPQPVYDLGYDTDDGLPPSEDEDEIDWPELPPEPQPVREPDATAESESESESE